MCVVKVTLDHTDHIRETRAYLKLQGQKGIPNLLWYGRIKSGWVLVLEYLRADLGMMQEVCPYIGQTTSLAVMALEMISCIQSVHSVGLIHGDIKPQNFTLGSVDDKDPTIFLMDLGSSFPYLINGKHIADGQVNTFVAVTPAFSPIRYHTEHHECVYDIESIAYILFDIRLQELPWYNKYNTKNSVQSPDDILPLKLDFHKEFAYVLLEPTLMAMLHYTRALEFDQAPDYDLLKGMFVGIELYKVDL
ncbi:kinase-like protein [Ramaria rubella]|nr:kinase-like protein [Ramaria rubella]